MPFFVKTRYYLVGYLQKHNRTYHSLLQNPQGWPEWARQPYITYFVERAHFWRLDPKFRSKAQCSVVAIVAAYHTWAGLYSVKVVISTGNHCVSWWHWRVVHKSSCRVLNTAHSWDSGHIFEVFSCSNHTRLQFQCARKWIQNIAYTIAYMCRHCCPRRQALLQHFCVRLVLTGEPTTTTTEHNGFLDFFLRVKNPSHPVMFIHQCHH